MVTVVQKRAQHSPLNDAPLHALAALAVAFAIRHRRAMEPTYRTLHFGTVGHIRVGYEWDPEGVDALVFSVFNLWIEPGFRGTGIIKGLLDRIEAMAFSGTLSKIMVRDLVNPRFAQHLNARGWRYSRTTCPSSRNKTVANFSFVAGLTQG